ncbi:MAG: hypothetical protein BRC33_05815 [Cyanobacteria bacterium SW_9_44_58]|nr:MAG: hypothetical protein BRC33_05815 [Cyanobacteria bacterium SW_9_44_58]
MYCLSFSVYLIGLRIAILVSPACSSNESTSRFDAAQQKSTHSGVTAVAEDAVKGGKLNRYFPKPNDPYQIVYTQEKRGFAQAKLKENGQELALMSISDIANNPSAADKFKESSETVQGSPVVNQGTKATAALVNNRYQVKIVSRSNNFNETSRKKWLEEFDLQTLAKL